MTSEVKTVEQEQSGNDEVKFASDNSVDSQAAISERDVKWRQKYKEALEKTETLKSKSEEEKKDLNEKLDQFQKNNAAMQQRVIDAELKAQAVAAGLKDVDFLKMIDISALKISEDGKIEGIDKAVNDLKSAKPFLFSDNKKTSTSKNESLPNGESKSTIDAMKLSDDEWKANRERYMSGHFN
jgi:hypothetical protein